MLAGFSTVLTSLCVARACSGADMYWPLSPFASEILCCRSCGSCIVQAPIGCFQCPSKTDPQLLAEGLLQISISSSVRMLCRFPRQVRVSFQAESRQIHYPRLLHRLFCLSAASASARHVRCSALGGPRARTGSEVEVITSLSNDLGEHQRCEHKHRACMGHGLQGSSHVPMMSQSRAQAGMHRYTSNSL